MEQILRAYDQSHDPRLLRFAVDLALDWLGSHPAEGTGAPLAWYDAAVGLRAFRLAYIADAAFRETYSATELQPLIEALLSHADCLSKDESFTSHNNHGFYQVAGELAIATRFPSLPGMSVARQRGFERCHRLLAEHFTEEGVHREHSPEYHYIIFLILEGALQPFVEMDTGLQRMRDRLEQALAWFVLPNQRIAMFGDSSHRLIARPKVSHQHDNLRFVLSGGSKGQPPRRRFQAFPQSGYVVMRDRWPSGPADFADSSYLAQACAFHSRTHKHADDLSFIWYDRGQELLIDAGRYGYGERSTPGSALDREGFWYSDPERIYVESTCAHNTVEIDGKSFPRRDASPYGSALLSWGETSGALYALSRARHDSVQHSRILVFSPRNWLLVLDGLEDSAGRSHDFSQRFLFAPELEVLSEENGVRATVPDEPAGLYVLSLLPGVTLQGPHRGEKHPRFLGWVSREDRCLTPTSTVAYMTPNVSHHIFATLLSFSDDAPRIDDAAVSPDGTVKVAWRVASRATEVHASLLGDRNEQPINGGPRQTVDIRCHAAA